jgi:hypothetical protein
MSQVISDYTQITRLANFGTLPFAATTLTLKPGASSTPANTGEVTFDFPDDRRIRWSAKGSDGQVRNFVGVRYNYATNSLSIGDTGDIMHSGVVDSAAWNVVAIGQGCAAGTGDFGLNYLSDSVLIGALCGNLLKTGNGNVMIGNRACDQVQFCHMTTAVGDSAWRKLVTTSGNEATGATAVGYICGQEITTANFDTIVGAYAGVYGTVTDRNTIIGAYAAAQGSIESKGPLGARNFVGGYAAYRYGGGDDNVVAGFQSGYLMQGDGNVAIGNVAGSIVTTASNSIWIGNLSGYQSAGVQKVDVSNSIAIGYNTWTTADNQVVLGNSAVTKTILRGNVTGIGSIDFTQDYITDKPTNGGFWRGSGYLYLTMATSGFRIVETTSVTILTQMDPTGAWHFKMPSSSTPLGNGWLTLEATSNTSVTIKLRGSDGITRTNVLTMA